MKYTYELKCKAVEMFFEGYSAEEIRKKLKISNRRRVNEWVRAVREANTMEVLLPNQGKPRKNAAKKESILEENERLKLENHYLKKLLELRKG